MVVRIAIMVMVAPFWTFITTFDLLFHHFVSISVADTAKVTISD